MTRKKRKEEKYIGHFEELDFDSIECPNSYAKHLLWNKKRKKTISMLVFSVVITVLLLFFNRDFRVIILGIIPFLAYCGRSFSSAQTYFMKQFALHNNLDYLSTIPLSEVTGNLFKEGRSKRIEHVLSGTYNNQKTRLFYYRYTVGHGKHSTTFRLTVLEIFFEKTDFPHILLKPARGRFFGRRGKREKGEIKINLEEEFKNDYDLFVKEGYGVEAMQIFTPEFLRLLKEENFSFSIEFKANRMYVYSNFTRQSKEQLQEIYEVAHGILDRIGPLLNRLENDFRSLHPYFKK